MRGAQGVSGAHPFGTDAIGRDVLARVLATGRGSLLLVVAAILIATVAGSLIGIVIGFAGGPLERIGVAALDGWARFPGELVALVLLAFNGRSGARAAVALAFVAAPAIARGAQQRTLAAVRGSDPDLATGAWLRSFGSRLSFGVARETLATVFAGAGRVLATEIVAGLLGLAPAATQTWSHELAIQLPFAAHAPQAVAAPLLVALLTAAALAALGNAMRPVALAGARSS
jgi:ABC-type dipeptide/oligopeptide/nickel transport system permease subunit